MEETQSITSQSSSDEVKEVDHKKVVLLNQSEDDFFMQYALAITSMRGNSHFKKLDYKVAAYLFKNFRKHEEIYLGIRLKEKMAEMLECKSTSSIANSFKVLKDADYLVNKGRRGYYTLNDFLAFNKAKKCELTVKLNYY